MIFVLISLSNTFAMCGREAIGRVSLTDLGMGILLSGVK